VRAAPAATPPPAPPKPKPKRKGKRKLRTAALAGLAVAGAAAARAREEAPAPGVVYHPGHEPWRMSISTHDGLTHGFTHDSLDSLGHDYERVSNPPMPGREPLKVYLPRNTEDVISVIREAKSLGQELKVRGSGHSSNDLIVTDHGNVIVTRYMDAILGIDEEALTVTVEPGVANAVVDDFLADRGYGLPVIGDHKDVTVGGFASVGGIGPASFRFGTFVDNILELEYVNWDGELRVCSREENSQEFHRVLAGLGAHGVLTKVTTRIYKVDKYATVWKNQETHFFDRQHYIEATLSHMLEPGDALMQRGIWIDFAGVAGERLALGQFSRYFATPQTAIAKARNAIAYEVLHRIGYVAGRLPRELDRVLKVIGTGGILYSPRYATIKNVEFFSDKIIKATVGDPTRMLIVLVPLDQYAALFERVWALLAGYRDNTGCFTVMSGYVKGLHSAYLANGRADDRFCELNFTVGIDLDKLTDPLFEEIISAVDDICIEQQSFRYMHTRTIKDPERRRLIDPNAAYSSPPFGVA
jgi:FAD binding domain